jgi:hypothetical protein
MKNFLLVLSVIFCFIGVILAIRKNPWWVAFTCLGLMFSTLSSINP